MGVIMTVLQAGGMLVCAFVSNSDWGIICGLSNRIASSEMRRNQVGPPRENNKIVCGLPSLMIEATTRLGRESPTAALKNSTLLFSCEPDGSPNYVTSDSASQPVPLTPGFID